jgi:ribonuclease BN (tRNA processing enzyme)
MDMLFDGTNFVNMKFSDYFEIIPLSWSLETTVGPFKIRATPTHHHITTSALTIKAGGRTLGYSSDTAFDPRVLTFLQDADLIIHETNVGPGHTPYESLARLPEGLRKKMRLIHYPDGFAQKDSNIRLLKQGELLTV